MSRRCGQRSACSDSWSWLPPARPWGRRLAPPPSRRLAGPARRSRRVRRAGHYAGLREARRIYGEAVDASLGRAGVAEKIARASIALGLREEARHPRPRPGPRPRRPSRPPTRRFPATLPGSSSSPGFPTRSRAVRGSTRRAAGASKPSSTGSTPASRRSTGTWEQRLRSTTSPPPSGWPCAPLSSSSSRTSSIRKPSSPCIRIPGWPLSKRPSLRPSSSRDSRPCSPATRASRKSIITSAKPRSSAENC